MAPSAAVRVRGDTLQHCSIHHHPLITGHCSDISYGGGIVLDSGMTLQHVSCMQRLRMAQFCKYPDTRGLVLWSAVQTTEDCVVVCPVHASGDMRHQGRVTGGGMPRSVCAWPRAPHPAAHHTASSLADTSHQPLTSTSPACHLHHAGHNTG